MMSTTKLIDVVSSLATYEDDLTIYVTEPWQCDSPAVVAREPDEGLPAAAETHGAVYFLEVFVAKEFLAGWIANEGNGISAQDQCDRLIRYAIYDA